MDRLVTYKTYALGETKDMTNIVLNEITSGYNINKVNANFNLIEDTINDEVLHVSGGNNTMSQDLDMNGYNLINTNYDPTSENAYLTLGYGDQRYYKLGQVPSAIDDDDAVNLGQVSTLITGIATGIPPDSIAIKSDYTSYGSDKGGNLISYKLDDTDITTVGTTLSSRMKLLPITPQDFGAVGDGVFDDTDAVNKTLAYAKVNNRAVYWGDLDKVYRITDTIFYDIENKDIRWVSDGAKLILDSTDHLIRFFDVETTGAFFTVEGNLTLDANKKANCVLFISNNSDGSSDDHYKDFHADNLHLYNAYRIDTTFLQSADGLFMRGAWNKVSGKFTVRESVLAAGAGVSGSYGAFGITIGNLSRAAFRICDIEVDINGVYSEDPDYILDQDGVRLFDAGEDVTRLYPWNTFFNITGKISNCRNRSIKSQCNFGNVYNLSVYRDKTHTAKIGGREIDMQVGGGSVDGLQAFYTNDVVPACLVGFTGVRTLGKKVPNCTAKNISCVVNGTTAMPYGIITSVTSGGTDVGQKVILSDASIEGPLGTFIRWQVQAPVSEILLMSDIICTPTTVFVESTRAIAVEVTTTFRADKCINLGSTIPLITVDNTSNKPRVSSTNCFGFTDAASISSLNTIHGAFTRVNGIGASNSEFSGLFRPIYYAVASGQTIQLPRSSLVYNSGIIMVTVAAGTVNDQAIFAVASNGAAKMDASSSNWVVGGTSEPATGNWKIWGSGNNTDGLFIKNNSGTSRSIMVWMYG